MKSLYKLKDIFWEPFAQIVGMYEKGIPGIDYKVFKRTIDEISYHKNDKIWYGFDSRDGTFLESEIPYMKNKKDAQKEAKQKMINLLKNGIISCADRIQIESTRKHQLEILLKQF